MQPTSISLITSDTMLPCSRAQGDADAYPPRAPRDDEREHAVQADDGEDRRQEREPARQVRDMRSLASRMSS